MQNVEAYSRLDILVSVSHLGALFLFAIPGYSNCTVVSRDIYMMQQDGVPFDVLLPHTCRSNMWLKAGHKNGQKPSELNQLTSPHQMNDHRPPGLFSEKNVIIPLI